MANEASCENSRSTAHFTVTGANEAGVDLVLLRKSCCCYANYYFFSKISISKERSLHQNKVNLSLTFTQRLEYYAHNCKMVYLHSCWKRERKRSIESI